MPGTRNLAKYPESLKSWIRKSYLFLFHKYGSFVHMYIFYYMYALCQWQLKRVPDPLELYLHPGLNHYVGVSN